MASHLLAVTFDAQHPLRVAAFWADMLGRDVVETDEGALLPADGPEVGLGFARCPTKKTQLNRAHLHLTSTSDADQQHTVDKALRLGAYHLDVGQLPEEGHVVLADPGHNEFCVIEANNAYLAGCGFLGEVACDGSRDVGMFWSQALGWPLVWDHGQETAIQSPLGGTKIGWGGLSTTPAATTLRQRFYLTSPDTDAKGETERLVALGATLLEDGTLVDPDGNEFRLVDPDGATTLS